MKANQILREEIFKVIENQLRHNDPPETKATLERLLKQGISKTNAKMYIGQCIAVEIFNVMKHHQPFDKKRYIKNLQNLPKEPFD